MPPKLSAEPSHEHLVINKHTDLVLTCAKQITPDVKYSFYKDKKLLVSHDQSTFIVKNLNYKDSGSYWCQVTRGHVDSLESSPTSNVHTVKMLGKYARGFKRFSL